MAAYSAIRSTCLDEDEDVVPSASHSRAVPLSIHNENYRDNHSGNDVALDILDSDDDFHRRRRRSSGSRRKGKGSRKGKLESKSCSSAEVTTLDARSSEDLDNGYKCLKAAVVPVGPIIELRGREVIFAILVFFFLSVSVGLIVVLATSNTDKKQSPDVTVTSPNGADEIEVSVCMSKECMHRAADMLDMMDQSANPCDDMWQYACGGFVSRVTIPAHRKSWGVDSEIETRTFDRLTQLLEVNPDEGGEPEVTSAQFKARIMYQKCLNERNIDKDGVRPILEALNRLGGWAVRGELGLA